MPPRPPSSSSSSSGSAPADASSAARARVLATVPGILKSPRSRRLFALAVAMLERQGHLDGFLERARKHEQFHARAGDESPHGISRHEVIWVALYEPLEAKGYRLPERFKPDWVAPWMKLPQKKLPRDSRSFERRFPGCFGKHLTDIRTCTATRVKDGRPVFLKALGSLVTASGFEARLHRVLASDDWLADKRNHTIPILETFVLDGIRELDEAGSTIEFFVFPSLKQPDPEDSRIVGYAVDGIRQLLEGVAFLHEHGIAHGDIDGRNVVISLAGPPFHLYIIDFETAEAPPLEELGLEGSVKIKRPASRQVSQGAVCRIMPPEISGPNAEAGKLYDPFKADVYQLSHAVEFCFGIIDGLEQIPSDMRTRDPLLRPSVQDCRDQFEAAAAKMSFWERWSSTMVRNKYRFRQGFVGRKEKLIWHLRGLLLRARAVVLGFDRR